MYHSLNNNYDEPTTTNSDIESGNACIICFEINDEDIIDIKDIRKNLKKCECSGYVHNKCISKWYKNKKHIKCIMCNTPIIKVIPRTPVTEQPRPNLPPASCKLMFFTVIITAIIVIAVFYPDAFKAPTRPRDDSAEDPSYLQSIMVGRY